MKRWLLAAWLFATPAFAQEEERDGRAATFQRADQSREHVPGGQLLVVAYGVIWALLFGFVALQWRRTQKLEAEVDRLTKALRDAGKGGGADAPGS